MMKTTLWKILTLSALLAATAVAQDDPNVGGFGGGGVGGRGAMPAPSVPADTHLIKFDLDFPGGTPNALVAAIEKASHHPLNAIIPNTLSDMQLPALRMKEVDVAQISQALTAATSKDVQYSIRRMGGSQAQGQAHTSFGFRVSGAYSDNSVWYFYRDEPPHESATEKICKYYNLGSYLATYKVEDITTAIQTGWKLLGDTDLPILNFHKDTKLLIAVGEPEKLQIIEQVLGQLSQGLNTPRALKTGIPAGAIAPNADEPK